MTAQRRTLREMLMKKLTTTIMACGILASGLHSANAATMRVSADNGATWTVVQDNGPFDADPAAGSILFVGTTTTGWQLVVATAIGSPAVGTVTAPRMDLGSTSLSPGPANLIIQMSDTGFTPFANETFVSTMSTTTGGSVIYNTYRDGGNVLFGTLSSYSGGPAGTSPSPTAALLSPEGPFVGGPNISSNAVVVPVGGSGPYSLTLETIINHPSAGFTSTDGLLFAVPPPPQIKLGNADTATIGFWHNKNGQALILGAPNSPALGNWLAANCGCLFGSLTNKSNADVAAAFQTDFGVTGQKTYAQVLAGAFAIFFTSSDLAGTGAAQYGFNVTPGGTVAKLYNVGNLGTTIGLINNQSYTILQILQQANADCPFTPAVFNAFNTIFSDINQTGDIN